MKMNGIQASLLGLLLCVVALRISTAQIVKPGKCPPERFYNSSYLTKTRACENDNECTGNKKCCEDNGFTICKPPAEERNGTCPANPDGTTISKPCDDMCTSDSECAPGSKCCFKNGGKTCLPTVEAKKGFCGLMAYCLVAERPHCNGDTGCPNDEKCCYSGCSSKCVMPLQEKYGKCPAVSKKPQDSSIKKGNPCTTDYDCEGRTKCCSTTWGKRCITPSYN